MDYIRLKDVYKTMKGTQVLKGVNLTVEQGDIVGIRGINGSGKTMVLRAIAGLIRVDGSVEIGGKKMEPGECPKDIGVLVEMPGFLPEFTGKKNLQLLGMLQEGVTEEDIEEAMNAVGLDPKDRRHYKKYSLGMKERLGIAQAILDEILPYMNIYPEWNRQRWYTNVGRIVAASKRSGKHHCRNKP